MTQADIWYLIAVIVFIVTDYVTGVIKAIMAGVLSSKKMREGLGHKFTYFVLILLAWFIDTVNTHVSIGLPVSMFVCTVSGVCLVELTSILENVTAINPELKNMPFMKAFSTTSASTPKHGE